MHRRRPAVRLLAALPLAALTGAAAPAPGAADAPALRPGLYEVTVEIVSAEPPLPGDLLARAHDAFPPSRQCMRRGRDQVGDTMQNGHCRYTHVDESGGRVRRLAVCDGGAVTHETDGTRTEESYDYTIVSRFAHPQASIFTGRERGRRIGDCPAPGSRRGARFASRVPRIQAPAYATFAMPSRQSVDHLVNTIAS
jgi:hypothetical protein